MPQRSAVEVNPLREGLRVKQGPEPCVMVIFGATGDLTHRKLLPALYNLALEHPLPAGFSVVGFARRPYNDDIFREQAKVKRALSLSWGSSLKLSVDPMRANVRPRPAGRCFTSAAEVEPN